MKFDLFSLNELGNIDVLKGLCEQSGIRLYPGFTTNIFVQTKDRPELIKLMNKRSKKYEC